MKITFGILALSALLLFGSGCGDMQASQAPQKEQTIEERNTTMNGHFTQKTPIKEVMESPVLNLTGGSFSPFIQAAGAVTPWKTSDSFGTVTSTPRRRQPLSMTFGSGRSKRNGIL